MNTLVIAGSFAFHFLSTASAAAANTGTIGVTFKESAPKDSFTLENVGTCPLAQLTVTLDLDGSAGGMIFDTVGTGPGLQVYQPFELVAGADRVIGATEVQDGGTSLTLRLNGLAVGERVEFTIDVDDTLKQSARGQTMVTGAEIAGARVVVSGASAAFGTNAKATLANLPCAAA